MFVFIDFFLKFMGDDVGYSPFVGNNCDDPRFFSLF